MQALSPYAKNIPIFWAHGTDDEIAPIGRTQDGIEFLKTELSIPTVADLGAPGIDFRTYTGLQHSTSEQELGDWGQWLKKVVPGQST